MEMVFEKKFFILLQLYEDGARKLEIQKWSKSIELYLKILESKSNEIYFLKKGKII